MRRSSISTTTIWCGLVVGLLVGIFKTPAAGPEPPATFLEDELRDIGLMIVEHLNAEQKALVAERLRGVRERLLEFTQTNSGPALDRRCWARTFESVYATCAQYEWSSYGEAEAAVREAWQVLSATQPEDPGLVYDISVRLPIWHAQAWLMRHPAECGALLAEAEKNLLPHATQAGRNNWAFFVPNFQRDIVRASAELAPEIKAELRAQAEATLQAQINDESQPFNIRNSHLCRWAMQLYSQGEADRAGKLLDAWAKKHGDKIVFPEFYYARFFAALRGAGGWEVANAMVNKINQLVYEGKASKDDPFYKLMMQGYYKNIAQPEYELERLAHTNRPPTKIK